MLTVTRHRKHLEQSLSVCRTVCKAVSHRSIKTILGIETSCDDTGAAVIDDNGHILSDVLHSQHQFHNDNGGIIPTLARSLHQRNIKEVVNSALAQSNIDLMDISAIATTVKPGLVLSLSVGLEYSKELVRACGKPFIPIHHMEAHALVARMTESVDFPFLVLLASGGHCQIAVVESVDRFLLLGTTTDIAPGDALDKVARRLKLKNLPQCSSMSGGESIEYIGKNGDPEAYHFSLPLYKYRTCNFSFSSLQTEAEKQICHEEENNGIFADEVLPDVKNFCASILHAVTRQLIRSVQRAMIFCERSNIIPQSRRRVVFSGGVACNKYIRTTLDSLCVHNDWELVCPPQKLCNDNGVMIAWNGLERLSVNVGVMKSAEEVKVNSRCPLGIDITQKVVDADIKVKIFNFHKHETHKSKECIT